LQLATNPPRHKTFRIVTAMVSSLTAFWVITATYNNQMMLLDSLGLLASSIAIGVTALERKFSLTPQGFRQVSMQ
jgi:hypothetical protein